ncbi:hypothetical protein SAMN05428996_2885 [Quadrisphaera sp. DSM 44207]|nr:hypothetical protein SAMN05428996_2885 [Quadrisphaera sp. DSM 44207]
MPVQLVSEGVVDGVELVTILAADGRVIERSVPLNDAAKSCAC